MEQENSFESLSFALSVGLDSNLSSENSQRKLQIKNGKSNKFLLEEEKIFNEYEREIELLQQEYHEDQVKKDAKIKETEFPLLKEKQKMFRTFTKVSVRTQRPWCIITISIVNTILVIASIIYNKGFEKFSLNPWAGPSAATLILFGAKDTQLMKQGQWWRFFTPIFLHAGIFHLILNLMAQVFLTFSFSLINELPIGIDLERRLGSWRLLIVYFSSGIAGNLLSGIFLPTYIQAGASGALFGLFSIYLVDFLINWRLYQRPALRVFVWMIFILLSLVQGIMPGVDNFAHVGGLLLGTLSSLMVLNRIEMEEIYGKPKVNICLWITRTICCMIVATFFIGGFFVFYKTDIGTECSWCKYFACVPLWNACKRK